MGQTGEVWQEFDTDPVALSSAQLNFPGCVALLIQVRELQGSAHCHSVSPGSAKSGTEEGRGAAALQQCCHSPQQCLVKWLRLTWGTARSHSSLSSLAPSFSAAAQPYKCVWSLRYLSRATQIIATLHHFRTLLTALSKLAGACTSQFLGLF